MWVANGQSGYQYETLSHRRHPTKRSRFRCVRSRHMIEPSDHRIGGFHHSLQSTLPCLRCRSHICTDYRAIDLSYCSRSYETNARCVSGHFICGRCHGSSARDFITQFRLHITQRDPVQMAHLMTRYPLNKECVQTDCPLDIDDPILYS